jgi:hypothetical protein
MHQPPKNTTGSRRFARRLVVALIVLLLGVVQVSLRSEAFVRPTIAPRLEALAATWNGRIQVDRILPHGLVGVELQGVEFRPHRWAPERDVPLLRVDRVIVAPDLSQLIAGRLALRQVRLIEPKVTALLDSEGGPLDAWLDWLAAELRSRRDRNDGANDAGDTPAIRSPPIVEVEGGFLTLDDRAGQYPSAGVRIETIQFDPATGALEGSVRVEGLGRAELSQSPERDGLTIRMLDASEVRGVLSATLPADADAALSMDRLTVAWPPRITVFELDLTGLNVAVPGPRGATVTRLSAEALTVALDGWGAVFEGVDAHLLLDDLGTEVGVTAAQFRFAHAWDHVETRVDGTLLDADGDSMTFALDRREAGDRILASVDGDDLDLARLVHLAPLPIEAVIDSGSVSIHADLAYHRALGTATGSVEAHCRNLSMTAPLLASGTVRGITGSLSGQYLYRPPDGTFELQSVHATLPTLGFTALGDAMIGQGTLRLHAQAQLDTRDAAVVFQALPHGFAPALQGVRATGDLGFDLQLALDTDHPTEAVAAFVLHGDRFGVEQFGPLAPIDELTRDDFAISMTTFEGWQRRVGPAAPGWTRLTEMPAHVYRAVLAAEDDGFFQHEGFDVRGIQRAVEINLAERRLARGGSTISQQVVKNLFLGHDRTIARKLQEAFLTWQLEARVPKTRILELYLNLAHWGPGVYGVGAAAEAYFGRPVAEITLREAAFLAAILPSPNRFAADYVEGVVAADRWLKMRHIVDNMERAGVVGPEAATAHRAALRDGRISAVPPPARLGEHLPRGVETTEDVQLVVPSPEP